MNLEPHAVCNIDSHIVLLLKMNEEYEYLGEWPQINCKLTNSIWLNSIDIDEAGNDEWILFHSYWYVMPY